MTPSTPTPPLPPPKLETAHGPAPTRTPLVVVTVLALLTAVVMTLLWLGARNMTSNAETEHDNTIAERNAANQATITADAELLTTQDELAGARAALEEAEANGASAESNETDTDTDEARQELIDELAAEVERLETENEALATDLADAQVAATVAEEASSTTVVEPVATTTTTTPATTTTTTTTSTTAPEPPPPSVSPDEIGEQISGLFRRSVLGPGQKSCLGQVMVNEFGEQRTLDGIASESPRDDEEFVDAIRAAAAFCNIDPSAIFG